MLYYYSLREVIFLREARGKRGQGGRETICNCYTDPQGGEGEGETATATQILREVGARGGGGDEGRGKGDRGGRGTRGEKDWDKLAYFTYVVVEGTAISSGSLVMCSY